MTQKRMKCFRPLFPHLAWIEHQFLSGIRDRRKAGSLWGLVRGVVGVRKSEHGRWLAKKIISLIRTVMCLYRQKRGQFDVSVGTVRTIIREELKMMKIFVKFVPSVLKDDQKERCCHDSREMVKLINTDPAVLDALVTCDESWIYCYGLDTKRQNSQWKHAGSPRRKKAGQSKSTHKLLMIPFLTALAWSTCTGFPLDRLSTRYTTSRF